MAEEKEALRAVWDGRIPVTLQLAPEDATALVDAPEPFTFMAFRLSYFPIVWEKALKYFKEFVSDDADLGSPWLEFEGQPLRWHYPVGLLYDLLVGDRPEEPPLPWFITLHYSNYPSDELLPGPSKEATESYFMSTIKEADALKHRSQVINAMQKRDHKQLWTGLASGRFDLFWSINKRLMDHEGAGGPEGLRYIPFRIHRPDKGFLQSLVRPCKSDRTEVTLGDLLRDCLTIDADNSRDVRKGDSQEPGHTCDQSTSCEDPVHKLTVKINGVCVPLSAPVAWLSNNLSYADNFLHIVVLP